MGVFNATQNQYTATPVTSYYKGKAMRAQIQGSELQNEMNRDTLEHADDARKAEAAKAQREADKNQREEERGQRESEKAKREAEDQLRKMGDAERADVRDANVAAQEAYDRTGSIEAATAAFKASADKGVNTPGIGSELDGFVWDPDSAAAQNAIFDENPDKPNAVTPTELTKLQNRRADPNTPKADLPEINDRIARLTEAKGGDGKSSSEERLVAGAIEKAVHARNGGIFGADGEIIPLEGGLASKEGATSRYAMQLWKSSNGTLDPTTAADIAYNMVDTGKITPDEIRGNKQEIGDILEKNGQKYVIVSFDAEGEPMVEAVD